MNTNNVNASYLSNVQEYDSMPSTVEFKKGQRIEGTITNVSDRISITFNGKEISFSESAVQNAKEGQIRTFEITDISNQSIVLKEVGSATEEVASNGVCSTIVMSTKGFIGEWQEEKEKSVGMEKHELQRQMDGIVNALSEEDYKALTKEDTLKEYTSTQLERAIARIKKQRVAKEKHLQNQVDNKEEKREEIEKAAVRNQSLGVDASKIQEKLEAYNLPVTKANITRLTMVLDMASTISTMSDASKVYMIANELPITPESIYKSNYSASNVTRNGQKEESFTAMKDKVEELLTKQQIPITEEVMNDAKWLFVYELPIAKDSLNTLKELNALQENTSIDKILDFCLQALEEGKNPKEVVLTEENDEQQLREKAVATVQMVHDIYEKDLYLVEEEEATIASLYKGMGRIEDISAKRKIEEIRLKLTVENSYFLYKQGIQVDTTKLSKLVEKLKELEKQQYEEAFYEVNCIPTDEQVALAMRTTEVVTDLKGIPDVLLGQFAGNRLNHTLEEIHTSAMDYRKSFKNKSEEYETLMTSPRKDLGDSMKKAFSSIDTILEEMDLPKTASNERAVRILAYNTMEISKKSIEEMKQYDWEINQVFEGLKPNVVVDLIRNNKNPLEMTMPSLQNEIAMRTDEHGMMTEEKFSEYLYKLDQRKELSTEERERYVEVYRVLHQVAKADGAPIGAVVQANQEVTLKTLQTAIRTKKVEGFDRTVDETVGFYDREMAKEAFRYLDSDIVANWEVRSKASIWETPMEELAAIMKQDGTITSKAGYESLISLYSNTEYAEILNKVGMEVTASNLEAVSLLMVERPQLYDMLVSQVPGVDEILKKIEKQLHDANSIEQTLSTSLEEADQMVEETFEEQLQEKEVTYEEARTFSRIRSAIQLTGELAKQGIYEIPVIIGESFVHMKVQMLEAKDGTAKLSIRMNEERSGIFDVNIEVKKEQVSGFVVSENRELYEHFMKKKNDLIDTIEGLGLNVKQFVISMNRKESNFYKEPTSTKGNTKVTTKTLYMIAKKLVEEVQNGMKEYEEEYDEN